MLSEQSFINYGNQGFTLIPLWYVFDLPNSFDTLRLYEVLANQGQDYLFETSQRHNNTFERAFSVIGLRCHDRFELSEGYLHHYQGDELYQKWECDDPLAELSRLHQALRAPELGQLPPFSGGLFGYFGFETTRLIEPRLRRQPRKPSGLTQPDAVQLLSLDLVVVDHQQGLIYCIVHGFPEECSGYQQAYERLARLVEQLQNFLSEASNTQKVQPIRLVQPQKLTYSFPQNEFLHAVDRIREYIVAGDVMQVVLSQRMSQNFQADATTLYRTLASQGDSPYRYLLNLGDSQIVGASPEMLFQKRGNQVISRPMAGTRRRGVDNREDQTLRDDLLSDPKEIAEHMMLVDLARNDLGRVAELGSVTVDKLLAVEHFPNVMHIVSTTECYVSPQVQAIDVLKSTFPAGTLSGASKIRALEVIAELEPHSRGVYGGSIGYMDLHGNADQAITIRTGVLANGQLHIQAGAGVVQDSHPEREWQETQEKSQLMLQAACASLQRQEEPEACI
ncbi:anthranilate synthase component I [Photorhabdus luminescens]|uniref:anthranilate synthase component I family protein n=1 Tax=Photorhabdus akhurstii TaxID=171438 RepID=UPI000CF9C73E|nr:anthranilate synthase component I [Photorhabdus luminescens]PQQ34049.1 anthranilate synthase component I [Photorhabdus luminescens]